MNKELDKVLAEIKEITNIYLMILRISKKYKDEPVNWVSVCCYDVKFVVDRNGKQSFIIFLEEISPDAYKIKNDIILFFASGEIKVDVVMEW